MNAEPELVTVYRSADSSAREDAQDVHTILEESGLSPVLVGDDAPGVPSGACEVRVPASQADRADALIEAAEEEAASEPGDPSRDLDLATIFSAIGVTAEVEALGVRTVLDANGIPTAFISPPQYPNLRFVVKVPKKYFAQAEKVLADARAAGPEAADEAERASEE